MTVLQGRRLLLWMAHNHCNNAQSDYLATEKHVAAWAERNRLHKDELQSRLQEAALPCDPWASVQITKWVYQQTEKANGQVWVAEKVLQHLSARLGRSACRLRSVRLWPLARSELFTIYVLTGRRHQFSSTASFTAFSNAGLLEALTWEPRRIQLVSGGPGRCSLTGREASVLVREMKFSAGFDAGFEWTDPHVPYPIGNVGPSGPRL